MNLYHEILIMAVLLNLFLTTWSWGAIGVTQKRIDEEFYKLDQRESAKKERGQ